IGIVLSNDRYICHSRVCSGLSFNRLADLKRHHNSFHSSKGERFWCSADGCHRSQGGKPFPRKDKRDEHVRTMHSD
ncbi:hypothetical protein AOQ84DRAFT_287980, partial [Glonium stellatum]